MGKKPMPLVDPNTLTLDQVAMLQSSRMSRAIKGMSPEHKRALLKECEEKIYVAQMKATSVGQECCDEKGVTRFPSPYTLVKKYSYLYTCISGWMTKEDLVNREEERFGKDWLVDQVTYLRKEYGKYSEGISTLNLKVEEMTYDELQNEYNILKEIKERR